MSKFNRLQKIEQYSKACIDFTHYVEQENGDLIDSHSEILEEVIINAGNKELLAHLEALKTGLDAIQDQLEREARILYKEINK